MNHLELGIGDVFRCTVDRPWNFPAFRAGWCFMVTSRECEVVGFTAVRRQGNGWEPVPWVEFDHQVCDDAIECASFEVISRSHAAAV